MKTMNNLTIKQLKALAAEKGITVVGDKRKKETWLNSLTQTEVATPTSTPEPARPTDEIETKTAIIKQLEEGKIIELNSLSKVEAREKAAIINPWLANNIRNHALKQLKKLSLTKLKTLAKERTIIPTGDTRKKATWANALA